MLLVVLLVVLVTSFDRSQKYDFLLQVMISGSINSAELHKLNEYQKGVYF